MKCDKLKVRNINDLSLHDIVNCDFYLKSEADKVIAEKDNEIAGLKADIADLRDDKKSTDTILDERNAKIAELKQKLEDAQATAYAESVDAGMRERRLKRALWLARVQRAIDKQKYYSECRSDGWVHRVNVWLEVELKCLKKAEEYR